jgi:hypothetical protein
MGKQSEEMKILTYNINKSTQEKIEKVLAFDADLLILPEVACPSKVTLPEDYRMEWMGDFPNKGLGVIWKPKLKVEVPSWFNPALQYFLPLLVGGQLIIAAWPTTTEQNKPMKYPQIALSAIQEYAPYIKALPTIITGDMNCYKGQSGETKRYSIQTIFDTLAEMGLSSAYHQWKDEALGEETVPTYYHQFKESQPFFIDYTFSSIPLKSYHLGEWDKELSDHVPQIIEI